MGNIGKVLGRCLEHQDLRRPIGSTEPEACQIGCASFVRSSASLTISAHVAQVVIAMMPNDAQQFRSSVASLVGGCMERGRGSSIS